MAPPQLPKFLSNPAAPRSSPKSGRSVSPGRTGPVWPYEWYLPPGFQWLINRILIGIHNPGPSTPPKKKTL